MTEYAPKSTTNFQQTQESREFADNLHSPHFIKRVIVYAVNSIIIKCWWWIKDACCPFLKRFPLWYEGQEHRNTLKGGKIKMEPQKIDATVDNPAERYHLQIAAELHIGNAQVAATAQLLGEG
ncbi:MAG: hypothetical protein Q8M86_03275, partial [Syntrophales bacterium]|nr:hypothetical protein [Syntrophales bacterium]